MFNKWIKIIKYNKSFLYCMMQVVELTWVCPGPSEGSGSSPALTAWRTPPDRDHASSLHLSPVWQYLSSYFFKVQVLQVKLKRTGPVKPWFFISFMQSNQIIDVFSLFLQARVSIQDQSYPLPRVHGYFQQFSLGYPQVVGAMPPMRVISVK